MSLSKPQLVCLQLAGLTLLSTTLMLLDDFLQQLYTGNNQARLETSYVVGMLAFNAGLWWSRSRWLTSLVLGLFALMQLMQLAHISYVGQPLNPVDISRMAEEWGEITEVADAAWKDHWPMMLAWGLPYVALFALFNRYLGRLELPGKPVAVVLILVALVSKPYWAATHNLVQFMPGPTRSSLHNSLSAYSFYVMRLSFGRSSLPDVAYLPYQLVQTPLASRPQHVWILLGETLRSDRMSVYGYARNTTPRLAEMHRQGQLQVVQGIAGAASTGVSIPLFMNGVMEPGNEEELRRGVGNLFRQAKAGGYHTFWLSTQESKLLNDVGADAIDTIFTEADNELAVQVQGDSLLLALVDKLPRDMPTFGVINMRAAHAPYENGYNHDKQFQPPWPAEGAAKAGNTYDNALRYVDNLVVDLMDKQVSQFPGNSVFLLTSDHGEMLGERGRWGHNVLTPEVAMVPAVSRVNWGENGAPALPDKPYLSHASLHGWVLGLLGARLENPNERADLAYFHGVDFYADNFFVTIMPDQVGRPVLGAPSLVSSLVRGL